MLKKKNIQIKNFVELKKCFLLLICKSNIFFFKQNLFNEQNFSKDQLFQTLFLAYLYILLSDYCCDLTLSAGMCVCVCVYVLIAYLYMGTCARLTILVIDLIFSKRFSQSITILFCCRQVNTYKLRGDKGTNVCM